jgi:hypothetical protein
VEDSGMDTPDDSDGRVGRRGRGADDGANHHADGHISGRNRPRGVEDNGIDAPDDSDGRIRVRR